MMSMSLLLSWRVGVTTSEVDSETIVVQGNGTSVTLRRVPVPILKALRRLDPPGLDEDSLLEIAQEDNVGILASWYYYIERLLQRGYLSCIAQSDGVSLATLIAVSPSFKSGPAQLTVGRQYVLSRFAYMHREGMQLVLESPLAQARIILNDCRATALVSLLATPSTSEELVEQLGNLGTDAVAGVLALLLRAKMVAEAGSEDKVTALETWEFHDLLFHARTRLGRFDAPYGSTYRFVNRLASPPALKPIMSGQIHELYRPDLDHLERYDPPFAQVHGQRRSIRDFDPMNPITERQLGEFLFRVARVTENHGEQVISTLHGSIRQDFAPRPYPAGGGLYELELYVAIQVCGNLESGLYYYDPAGHRLIRLCGRTPEVAGLLRDAAASTGAAEDTLQVLLILAARFPRIAWKYQSIAYALTLKHVGVLYHTMYLAATAMGLAPCAVGGGDADLFARAAGTDYYAETSVGEFLLGNPRPGQVDRVC
jgi:SagB-type dehydrogenase family enzyme